MASTQLAKGSNMQNCEKATDFLSGIEAPGSLVSNSGALVHLNEEMALLLKNQFNGSSSKCQWLSSAGTSSCSNCSEKPDSGDQCFVMRENDFLSLLAAVRLPHANNALMRVYRDESSGTPTDAEKIIEKIMNFASPVSHYSVDDSMAGDGGFIHANLCELVDSAIKKLGATKLDIKNQVDTFQEIDSTSPIILRQVVLNILTEFSRLELRSPVTIRNMRQAGPMDDHMTHMLYFNAKSSKPLGKSKSSELTASGLRFKSLCRNIRGATGLEIDPPIVFQENDTVEVQFSFPNQFTMKAGVGNFEDDATYHNLSAREQEIVEMVRNGYDNIGISEKLGITHATVKQHLKAIYRKVEVKNRVELIFKNGQPYA